MGWFKGTPAKQKKTNVSFLSNLRFRTKIMLGFVIVLGISAINMGVAYFGFERIAQGVQSYQGIVAETDSARDIDRELAAYQLLARYYVTTGLPADEEAARAAEASLGSAIERAARVATAGNRKSVLNLSASYSEFAGLFGEVIKLKTENAAIAANQLLRMGNVIRYKFDDLADTAILAGLSSIQQNAKELATHSASITSNISNYVLRPDAAVANSVNARMQLLKNSFGTLSADDAKLTSKIAEITQELDAYKVAFTKFVENTAKIAALSTKMNEAASAVTQEAKGIKDGLLVQQSRLAKESAEAAHTTGKFVTILGGGGIAFGAILAWMLGRGISRPMIGMCDAMRQLAGGNFDVVLPGLGRKDEIGEMAGAVEEFKMRAVAKAQSEAAEREEQGKSATAARSASFIASPTISRPPSE